MRIAAALLLGGFLAQTTPVAALELSACTRVTHVSHGGEAFHQDLGEGRVLWLDWWSQEGSAHDLRIVDCESGQMLSLRTAEENMRPRPPFHRTERALNLITREHRAARVFVTLPRLAQALEKTAKDIEITERQQQSCACAALYQDLRGSKAPFVLAPLVEGQ